MIKLSEQDQKWVEEFLAKIIKKSERVALEVRDMLPYLIEDGKYEDMKEKDPGWWTNGFYGGMMWLLYLATKNEEFKKTAQSHEKLMDGVLFDFNRLDHDAGFMWDLTAKASYEITGDRTSRSRALHAAASLASRYNVPGGYIRAWNSRPTYTIIDCMMNIPLLYWASRELKDDRFKYFGMAHADMVIREHVREDGSLIHIVEHEETSEKIVQTLGGQGYQDGSTWSRGQAWAVYGFVLSYIHTQEERYLDIAKKVTDYFIKEVAKTNYKTLTDFRAPETPVVYDNSAGACAACGMIELYKITKDEKYLDAAIRILKAMEEDCDFSQDDQSIVQNCMVRYGAEQLHLIYADFYLTEALMKLKGSDYLIW